MTINQLVLCFDSLAPPRSPRRWWLRTSLNPKGGEVSYEQLLRRVGWGKWVTSEDRKLKFRFKGFIMDHSSAIYLLYYLNLIKWISDVVNITLWQITDIVTSLPIPDLFKIQFYCCRIIALWLLSPCDYFLSWSRCRHNIRYLLY